MSNHFTTQTCKITANPSQRILFKSLSIHRELILTNHFFRTKVDPRNNINIPQSTSSIWNIHLSHTKGVKRREKSVIAINFLYIADFHLLSLESEKKVRRTGGVLKSTCFTTILWTTIRNHLRAFKLNVIKSPFCICLGLHMWHIMKYYVYVLLCCCGENLRLWTSSVASLKLHCVCWRYGISSS